MKNYYGILPCDEKAVEEIGEVVKKEDNLSERLMALEIIIQ